MIQRIRISSLIGIHVLILAHIYYFGDSVIGSVDFQEFFHAFIKYGIINAGVVMVMIAFISTLIFGRFFCGWACHFGALQEFSWWVLKKMNIVPKTINSSLVTILPLFILLNFYVAPNLIHSIKMPWEKLVINFGMPEIWAFLPGFMIGLLTFIVDGFLIVYFLGRKGFCRFLCPWGAFLKLPSSLAMFKVRKVGTCIECGVCTDNCPIGIDVTYEINNHEKVTNTNCTSCMVCTDGCPSQAIAYKWKNPFRENFQFKHYGLNLKMFKLSAISDKFQSVHKQDYLLLPLILFCGFCIDGLYGMGHFLSFGIATIIAIQVIDPNKKINFLLKYLLIAIIIWHGIIKFSIWRGLDHYDSQRHGPAISHLNRVVMMYPKPIGRFHMILSEMYLHEGNFIKAEKHALIASKINPEHEGPKQFLNKLYYKIDNQ